jgi:hypothetical protein
MSKTFRLPRALAIVEGEYGEHVALTVSPSCTGANVVAVEYTSDACACTSGAEWVDAIKCRAIAAYRRGESSITI